MIMLSVTKSGLTGSTHRASEQDHTGSQSNSPIVLGHEMCRVLQIALSKQMGKLLAGFG